MGIDVMLLLSMESGVGFNGPAEWRSVVASGNNGNRSVDDDEPSIVARGRITASSPPEIRPSAFASSSESTFTYAAGNHPHDPLT